MLIDVASINTQVKSSQGILQRTLGPTEVNYRNIPVAGSPPLDPRNLVPQNGNAPRLLAPDPFNDFLIHHNRFNQYFPGGLVKGTLPRSMRNRHAVFKR